MPVVQLWFSLGLLSAGALVGILLLSSHVKRRFPPISAALAHGFLAACGIALVAVFLATARPGQRPFGRIDYGPWPLVTLSLLLLTAAGGGVLFWMHLRRRPLPILLMGVHAAGGLIAILLLIMILQVRAETGSPIPLNPEEAERTPPPLSPPAQPR